jgi:transposase-like protein
VTLSHLLASWREALAAAAAALAAAKENRVYSPADAAELERRLAAERRWLDRFPKAAFRGFP